MERTEFSIYLYLEISQAINEFLEANKDESTYPHYRLSIEPNKQEGLLIPYEVSFLPNDQADYLFMPRLSELLEDYVNMDTADVEPIPCIHAIAAFIDHWIGSGKWNEEPLL